jgi:hypothetical protein
MDRLGERRVRARMACEHAAMILGLASLAFVPAPAQPGADVDSAEPRENATSSCPLVVRDLPPSPLFALDDRRLTRASLLVVDKGARRLMVFERGVLAHCFPIGLGFAPRGHKEREGDGRTPEGWYRTSDKPWSSFEGAIAVHYPNAVDAEDAHRKRRITRRTRDEIAAAQRSKRVPPQRTEMGGAILIHGGGAHRDWTLGCVALDDEDLTTLRGALPSSMRTELLILP